MGESRGLFLTIHLSMISREWDLDLLKAVEERHQEMGEYQWTRSGLLTLNPSMRKVSRTYSQTSFANLMRHQRSTRMILRMLTMIITGQMTVLFPTLSLLHLWRLILININITQGAHKIISVNMIKSFPLDGLSVKYLSPPPPQLCRVSNTMSGSETAASACSGRSSTGKNSWSLSPSM